MIIQLYKYIYVLHCIIISFEKSKGRRITLRPHRSFLPDRRPRLRLLLLLLHTPASALLQLPPLHRILLLSFCILMRLPIYFLALMFRCSLYSTRFPSWCG